MLRLFDALLGSFDRLFVSIGSAELKGGAERLRAGAARSELAVHFLWVVETVTRFPLSPSLWSAPVAACRLSNVRGRI